MHLTRTWAQQNITLTRLPGLAARPSHERLVRFAYRGRRRNHKHCRLVGRPSRYLRGGTRRERLPGLPDLGADQCGVSGCDWRSDTNPRCNSHSNACGDTYSNTNSHRARRGPLLHQGLVRQQGPSRLRRQDPDTLQRQQAGRDGGSSEASTSFAIDRYAKKSLNRSSCRWKHKLAPRR